MALAEGSGTTKRFWLSNFEPNLKTGEKFGAGEERLPPCKHAST